MDQTPRAAYGGQSKEPLYEGDGEVVRVQHRRRADHRPNVTYAASGGYPGRQPLGRTEELRQAEEARYSRGMPKEEQPPRPKKKRRPRKKQSGAARAAWMLVILLCLMCIGALGLFVAPQVLGVQYATLPNYAFVNGSIITLDNAKYANYRTYRKYLSSGAIYAGVTIDGVDVGGMTPEQAVQAVSRVSATEGASFQITVNIGNKSWSIDSGKVPMTRNVEEAVAQAYAYGRENTTAIRGTRTTPFQERLNTALSLAANPVSLTTAITYDRETIRAMTDSIVAFVNRDPVNASVATFDFNTKSFTFNADTPGAYVDAEELYAQVIACLDRQDYNATLTVEPEMILAAVTKAELMNSFRRVSSYTTDTTSNSNRNTNIQLSAAAINGTTVLPGETFSFNQATGQRTAEKGYKEATAISGGQNVPEVGGGVCQTSSTLFNAVARANLEIVSRSPHAWPSSYVEKGMDATVNWPNLDFQFRNNTDWPVFIVAYYQNRKVTVELYGMSLGEGITIDLESTVTKTIKPPEGIKYVQNTSLPAGTSKSTVKARTGYVVETYQVWYQNGQEYKRELLCTSNYKAYQETVEYN